MRAGGPRQGSAWTCAWRPRDWPRILIYLAYNGLRRLLNGSGPLGECLGTRELSNTSRGVISKQATPKATTRSEVRDHREAFGDLPQRFASLLDRALSA